VIALENVLARLRRLPTLSVAAVKLTELARSERSSAADFEKVIRPDPALTANLLRIANSAYFGVRCRVESVKQATTLLGLKRTSEIAAAAALGPVIPKHLPGYDVEASVFWSHCISVAVLSERLAVELNVKRPDLTFTAGLLHDIGKIALDQCFAPEYGPVVAAVEGGAAGLDAERGLLGITHAEVGAMVAIQWNFPEPLVQAIRGHHEPPPGGFLAGLIHLCDLLVRTRIPNGPADENLAFVLEEEPAWRDVFAGAADLDEERLTFGIDDELDHAVTFVKLVFQE